MDLISNDWKHKIRKKPREFFVKISCLDNKGTRKIKDLQKLSNKEIYFSFQSNNTKYIKPFEFVS